MYTTFRTSRNNYMLFAVCFVEQAGGKVTVKRDFFVADGTLALNAGFRARKAVRAAVYGAQLI